MPPLPRAMLIDLDDTLLSAYNNPGPLWLEVATEFEEHLGGVSPEDAATAFLATADAFWDDPERHRKWRQTMIPARREVVRLAFEALRQRGIPAPSTAAIHAIADRFSSLREQRYTLFPGTLETLEALRSEGLRLALVTNGAGDIQRSKIERFGLAPYFHHIQIEGECGFGKPEDRCYRHALEALGAEAHEAWMVGDNLEWEVAAPQRLGIFAVWHDHAGAGLPAGSTVQPDLIVRSLGELLGP